MQSQMMFSLTSSAQIWINSMTTTSIGTIDTAARAQEIREVGYTVLRDHLDRAAVARIAEAFWPVYHAYIDKHRDKSNRGAHRHYIPLPFAAPFYQAALFADPTILAIVRAVLGHDMRITQYASDTPAKGSVHQAIHSDIEPLFPEQPDLVIPPALICANFSFIDVTPAHGPFEVADGSHLLPRAATIEKISAGDIPLRPLCLNIGDVLIRDPRCLHRGTPNTTDQPRPVAVIGFERFWHQRPGHIGESPLTQQFFDSLPEPEQSLLRHVPRSA